MKVREAVERRIWFVCVLHLYPPTPGCILFFLICAPSGAVCDATIHVCSIYIWDQCTCRVGQSDRYSKCKCLKAQITVPHSAQHMCGWVVCGCGCCWANASIDNTISFINMCMFIYDILSVFIAIDSLWMQIYILSVCISSYRAMGDLHQAYRACCPRIKWWNIVRYMLVYILCVCSSTCESWIQKSHIFMRIP